MLTEAPGSQEGLGVIQCILANLQLRRSGGDVTPARQSRAPHWDDGRPESRSPRLQSIWTDGCFRFAVASGRTALCVNSVTAQQLRKLRERLRIEVNTQNC